MRPALIHQTIRKSQPQFIRMLVAVGLGLLTACSSPDNRREQDAAYIEWQQRDVDALYSAATAMLKLDGLSIDARVAEAGSMPSGSRQVKIKCLESDFACVYLTEIDRVSLFAADRRSWVVERLAVLCGNQPRGSLLSGMILRHLDNRVLGIRMTPSAVIQDFQTLKYVGS